MASRAKSLRDEGNTHFGSASAAGIAPVLVRSRLEKALELYRQSLTSSTNNEERAAAHKNAAVVGARLLGKTQFEEAGFAPRFAALAKIALRDFISAASFGERSKPADWVSDVSASACQCVAEAFAALESNTAGAVRLAAEERLSSALDLATGSTADRPASAAGGGPAAPAAAASPALLVALARANITCAEHVLQEVVVLVQAAGSTKKKPEGAAAGEDGDGEAAEEGAHLERRERDRAAEQVAVRKGIPLLYSAHPFLDRAARLADMARAQGRGGGEEGDGEAGEEVADVVSDIQSMRDSLDLHAAILESTQSRLKGEEQLAAALAAVDEGARLVEGAYDALDSFKQAVVCAREKDLEGEAVALSRQASVFADVLKQADKAYPLFLRAITLAAACAPRSFHGQSWYDTAVAHVQKERVAASAAAEEAQAKDEAELLSGMKAQCDAVEAASKKGAAALLKHLYSTHPPRKEGAVMGGVGGDEIKKTLKEAIVHYHPDRQKKPQPGGEGSTAEVIREAAVWRAFCSYVTKRLTPFYEMMKGLD